MRSSKQSRKRRRVSTDMSVANAGDSSDHPGTPRSASRPSKQLSDTNRKKARTSAADQTETVSDKASSVTVHEVGFLKPHVAGCTAVAVTPKGDRMAVARTDFSIELLERIQYWIPMFVVYPNSGRPDMSVTSLQFTPCGDYLFTSRLDGSLSVFVVLAEGLVPYVSFPCGGGAIWDMAFVPGNPTYEFRLAVACDDGHVRLITPDLEFATLCELSDDRGKIPLSSDSSHYTISVSDECRARAMSVAWGSRKKGPGKKNYDFVVCGDSKGGLHWIDMETMRAFGHAQIPLSRQEDIVIWTVQAAHDGNRIVCGDDRGLVTIWSSKTNTMEGEIRIEGTKGPIWCSAVIMCSNRSEVIIFGCANGGVGGLRLSYEDSGWSHLRARLFHTHDVRGVAAFGNENFVTASIDSRIMIASQETLVDASKSPSCLVLPDGVASQSGIQVEPNHDIVMSKGSRKLEFWHIPEAEKIPPNLLLRMKLNVTSTLRACAISNDCTHVAVSEAESFRLYRIWDGDGEVEKSASFGKVELLELKPSIESVLCGCVSVLFIPSMIIGISRCRTKIVYYNLDSQTYFETPKSNVGSSAIYLTKIAYAKCVLAVCDSRGGVFVTPFKSVNNVKWQRLYENGKRITVLVVSPSGSNVVFGCNDGELNMARIRMKGGSMMVSKTFNSIVNCVTIPKREKSFLVSGLHFVKVLSCLEWKQTKKANRKKAITFSDTDVSAKGPLWITGILKGGRALVIRKRLDVVQDDLPDSIARKRYGG